MDIDPRSLIEAVATTGGHIRSILTDVQSLQALAKDRKLDAEIVDKIVDISLMVSDTRTQNAELKAKLVVLEAELAAFKRELDAQQNIEQRKRNYVLVETPMGERIYRLKPEADAGEPPHEVCPTCFEGDQIAILQPRGAVLECDNCKATFRTEKDSGPMVIRRTREIW